MTYLAGPRPMKLTADQVTTIRNRYRRYDRFNSGRALAREFGVSAVEIHYIVTRKHWKHVP